MCVQCDSVPVPTPLPVPVPVPSEPDVDPVPPPQCKPSIVFEERCVETYECKDNTDCTDEKNLDYCKKCCNLKTECRIYKIEIKC